ncbi:MAG: DMT family transporter [Firmicutes bacterium]|nr:DMT family transporter [Bacillota bacterium]
MSQKSKGILCILSSAFFFALMSLFVNLSGNVPVIQKSFFRNIVAAVISFVILVRSKEKVTIGKGNLKLLLARSTCGYVGILCNFYATSNMNISDAQMLNKLSPFFAIVFSYIILKEVAGKVDWIAVVIAFLSSLLVVKPTFSFDVIPALIGVLGGMTAGCAYTFVRLLTGRGVKSAFIIFFFSAFSTIMSLPTILFDYSPMTTHQLAYLILAGCAAAGGQISITAAYKRAPAKELSVFDFSQVAFAALLGFVFLGQMPDYLSIIGYVLIIGTAVAKWKYTLKKDKKI